MSSSVELNRAASRAVDDSTVALGLLGVIQKPGAAARFRRTIVWSEAVADLLTVTSAVMLGYFIYNTFGFGKHVHYPLRTVLAVAAAFSVVIVLMLDRVGAYRGGNSLLRVRETEQVLRVSTESFLMIFAVSFFSNILFSRWLLLLCLGLVPLLLFVQKNLTYMLVTFLHSRGYANEKVLIYGAGGTGRRVFSVLRRSPKLGLEPVAFVDDDPAKTGSTIHEMGYGRRRSVAVVSGSVARESIATMGVDLVIIAIPSIGRERFLKAVNEALSANARVSFVPNHLLPSDPWLDYQDIDGVLLASFSRSNRRFGYEVVKRLSDIIGATGLLLIGVPIYALLAIIIRLDGSSPVMFGQERVGLNGKHFRMYKFRTMHHAAAPYDYSPRASDDPRITRVGRFLRRTSLDELPQLFNVLRGDMSLVGPRPEMPFIVERYGERHRQRLQVKPGITGLWQLSGDRAFLIHENVEYDLYYIQHRNFFMDLAILLHTVVFAMRGI
jgi:exopolysaccharide biosynthesis polyprenyl glycosylphosphotransferase